MRTLAVSILGWVALAVGSAPARAEEPTIRRRPVFPREARHNHASCLVERPDGSLLVAWYRGSGERTADDVQVMGARLAKGAEAWGGRFVMADTPGYPDLNPALFSAPEGPLWLVWPTVLDHRWEGALLKFAVADRDAGPGAPTWDREGVFHVTPPSGFDREIARGLASLPAGTLKVDETSVEDLAIRSKDLLYQRLGWMPRVHPTVLPSGRWLWPLYCDTFSVSIVAVSDDRGRTWTTSRPIVGFGNIQPSLVRKADGTIVAFMRDNGSHRKIRLSTSKDDGLTWTDAADSDLPNPGAGIEAIRLANGHWALAHNDTTAGRHSLAVSISTDEGTRWVTRHVERHPEGRGSYHYPSLIQAKDGLIHLTYTSGGHPDGSQIMHATFEEGWVDRGNWERPLSWTHQNRRLRIRYERRPGIHQVFLTLAFIKICASGLFAGLC